MTYGIWLIVLGALAVPNLILRKPELKSVLTKIMPYQGWIGAISVFWGAWAIISSILHMSLLAHWPIWWITWLATGVVTLAVGLLLGVGMVKTFVKNEAAQSKLDLTVSKLAPYQGTLGVAALGLGVWCIVANILFL